VLERDEAPTASIKSAARSGHARATMQGPPIGIDHLEIKWSQWSGTARFLMRKSILGKAEKRRILWIS
jgi:hypothetical protein